MIIRARPRKARHALRRAAGAALACLGAGLAAAVPPRAATAQGGNAGAPEVRVRAGVTVRPDTVTVGDPFVVTIRVEAPAGAAVAFPPEPDSGGAVALLDPRRAASQPSAGADGAVDHLATYRMAAWDVGELPVPLGDVVVTAAGAERRVPLGNLRVFVRSVLPEDSAARVPKPVRAPLPDAGAWWLRYWPWILLALLLLALLAWAISRWLRRRREQPREDPYRHAVAQFERLDRMGLVEAGERGRHVALAVEVLRDYLAARLPDAPNSLTSTELLRALAGRPDVPAERLSRLLEVADLVKFAAAPVTAEGARGAAAESRGVVDEIERRVRERERQEAELAEARRRADRDEARRYEEQRRREQSRREAA